MSPPFTPQGGVVFSADIAVPEHEREIRFYSRVLSTGANPLWRAEDLMNNLGMPVIGLGARTPEYAELPLQWMPHIQVTDVGASVMRALELGGTTLMDARDDAGNHQWAVLSDPNGTAFGLIPVVPADAIPPGAAAAAESGPVGRIAWLDLTVPNAPATRDFYRGVIGWSVKDVDMKDGEERYADYAMLAADGSAAAGVCHARGTNAGLPPVWMLYPPVGDMDESLRLVEEEGGTVLRAVRNKDGAYFYAAIQDPVGVTFGMVPAT